MSDTPEANRDSEDIFTREAGEYDEREYMQKVIEGIKDGIRLSFGIDEHDTPTIKRRITTYTNRLFKTYIGSDTDPDLTAFSFPLLNWICRIGGGQPITKTVALVKEPEQYELFCLPWGRQEEFSLDEWEAFMQNAFDMVQALVQTPFFQELVPYVEEIERLRKAERETRTHYSAIRQGRITNTLTKVTTTKKDIAKVDPITGTATITRGDYTITIPFFATIAGLRTTTGQLFDILTRELTQTGAKSPTVYLSLTEYMEARGLKDRKEARKRMIEDLETLMQTSISGKERRGNKDVLYGQVNIADSWVWADKRKTKIAFTFGATLYQILLQCNIMPYPEQLLRIDSRRNPTGYVIGRKICELKNMNAGKDNENIIAVSTLLTAIADYIPTYDDIMQTSRHLERIIDPFENGLNTPELSELFSWEYCHAKGEPLTDAELENMSYHLFITLNIRIVWKSYPDATEWLSRKRAKLDTARKRKEAAEKRAAGKRTADTQKDDSPDDSST